MPTSAPKGLEPTDTELRMRCIEAVAQTGVREPQRLVNDAKYLYDWLTGSREDKG